MALSQQGAAPAILVLEDDEDVRRLVTAAFAAAGFDVRAAATVEQAMTSARVQGLPALAVVDLLLDGEGGLEFCRRVHEFSDLPIVVLTSVTGAGSAIAAIERFAEDYVRKPFDAQELVARVLRILRRVGAVAVGEAGRLVLSPELSVDLVRQTAWCRGEPVGLTPTECRLLHILALNRGRTVETGTLLRRLWPEGGVFEDALRVHVHRLRRKIAPDPGGPALLVTERGLGYRLDKAP